jgi:hypothetical protein
VTAEQALKAAAALCRQKGDEWLLGNTNLQVVGRAQAAYFLASIIERLDLSPASVSSVNLRPDGAGAGNFGDEKQP